MKKLLFIALSDSQEKYFSDISRQENIDGTVIRLKYFKHGSYLKGKQWASSKQLDIDSWLLFKAEKTALNKPLYSSFPFKQLLRAGLAFTALKFLASFVVKLKQLQPHAIVVLNGAHYKQQVAIAAAKALNINVLYLELGCLPNTTMIDNAGVNYNCNIPKDANFYLNLSNTETAKSLPSKLLARPSVKTTTKEITLPEKYIFVPFQVRDDTQILLHSPWINSMYELYDRITNAAEHLDSDYIFVVKEHPSDKKTYKELHERHPRIIFANSNNTQELIDNATAVITINSTVGIESLLLQKPVICLGNAFYSFSGLTHPANNQNELNSLVQKPSLLSINHDLVTKFLNYFREKHLITGRPKDYDQEHLQLMASKMVLLSNDEKL